MDFYSKQLHFIRPSFFYFFVLPIFLCNKLGSEDEIKIKLNSFRPFSNQIKIEGNSNSSFENLNVCFLASQRYNAKNTHFTASIGS